MYICQIVINEFHNYWGDDGRKVALLAIIAPQFQSLAPTTQNWRTMWSFILTTIARTQHDHNLLEHMDLIGCLMYFNWGILCLWCVSIDGQDAVEDAIKRIWSDCIDRRPEDGRRWFITSQNANPCVHLSPRGPSCQSTICFFLYFFRAGFVFYMSRRCDGWVLENLSTGGFPPWNITSHPPSRCCVYLSIHVLYSTSIVILINNGNTRTPPLALSLLNQIDNYPTWRWIVEQTQSS